MGAVCLRAGTKRLADEPEPTTCEKTEANAKSLPEPQIGAKRLPEAESGAEIQAKGEESQEAPAESPQAAPTERPASEDLQQSGPTVPERKSTNSNSLDEDQSALLRQYAKRNRPSKKAGGKGRFMSTPAAITPIDAEDPAENTAVEQASMPVMPVFEEKMKKYDIFDSIDGDRLKEFDELFSQVKKNSNYEAHKKKTRNLSKNKFATSAAVSTDEETGQTSIT